MQSGVEAIAAPCAASHAFGAHLVCCLTFFFRRKLLRTVMFPPQGVLLSYSPCNLRMIVPSLSDSFEVRLRRLPSTWLRRIHPGGTPGRQGWFGFWLKGWFRKAGIVQFSCVCVCFCCWSFSFLSFFLPLSLSDCLSNCGAWSPQPGCTGCLSTRVDQGMKTLL